MRLNWSIHIRVLCLAGACLCTRPTFAGTLTGTQTAAPSTVSLTAEGTLDWVHWGLNTEIDFDHKAGGLDRISNFTPITGVVANDVTRFDDAGVAYSWTDGTPTENAALTTTGVYIAGLTNGFQFTVAADTELRVLKVYAAAWNARIHFEATLSDGSAAALVDESLEDFGAALGAVYSVEFAADSPGQALMIRIYSSALHDPDGNCALMAASLGTPPSGVLSGSNTFLANGAEVDLTGEGTLDWAHWGLASETDFNHKTTAAQQISNLTPIGTGFITQAAGSAATYAWTNGAPTPAASTMTGVLVYGEGNGFQFTVPADTTPKVLRVYVNAYSARVHFEAALSDGSAPVLSDDSFDTLTMQQGPVRVYAVSYAAAAAGQSLTVKCAVGVDEGAGYVSLHAASLQPQPAQTGTLGGGYTVLAAASTINLTDEGRIDWAHWGIVEAIDVDRKTITTNVISDFAVIGVDQSGGPLEVVQFGDNFTTYSWTDGTPTATATSTGTGIWLAQPGVTAGPGLNTGFEISVPADPDVRALKVYLGAYACRMHFEAMLSDGSAPPFVDESFFNDGDGPNRVYTLTFAAASPGQKLIVRWWIQTLADETWGNVTLQSVALREAAPIVSLVTPANGSIFNLASQGLRFTASTIQPFSIDPQQVGLLLNGMDLSSSLVVSGSPTARSVQYTNLTVNQFYSGQIWAADNLGNSTTNFVTFDTFTTNGVVVIEAEDFNHDFGQYIDYPAPGAYAGLAGALEVDYYTVNGFVNAYRQDPLQIVEAVETRPYFNAAGADNYAVTDWNVGDWQNYTRSFPDGRYHVYLRYGALMNQSVQLDLVTGDRTQFNQTVAPLGLLIAPQINSDALYRYAALTDTSNNPVAIALSGVQTLRMTGADVAVGYGGLVADFFMFVPFAEQVSLSISSGGGQVTLSFPTQTGTSYTLQYKDRLEDLNWQSRLPSIQGDGSVRELSEPVGPASRFYRLSVE